MATFVKHQSVDGWTATLLNECWLMEVGDGSYVAGLVWAHWVIGADRVIEIHAAASSAYRGRWLTSRVLDSLFQIVGVSGARAMLAQTTTPLAERIWRGFGFNVAAGLAYLDVEAWHAKEGETAER